MQLSLSKIAKGDSAGLMSAVAKATVDECGHNNVASSFSMQHVFACWKGTLNGILANSGAFPQFQSVQSCPIFVLTSKW